MHNKKFLLFRKYPLKHAFAYIVKHMKKNEETDNNVSLDLIENHYVNTQVKQISKEGCKTIRNNQMLVGNYKRKKRVSKKTKKKSFSGISELCFRKKMTLRNIYSPLKKETPEMFNDSVPSPIKSLPVIPFWRTSFEIITKANNNNNNKTLCKEESFDRRRSTWLYLDNNYSHSLENNYITMKKSNYREENIYV